MSRLVLAEFGTAEALMGAVRGLAGLHLRRVETFTPFLVEELHELVEEPPSKVRAVMVAAAVAGAAFGFAMPYYAAVIDYPINSGGRPLNSWPVFMLITFELAILFAAVAGFVAMLWANGLPRLNHPRFDWEGFERASDDRFFVEVELADDADGAEASRRLERGGALRVRERAP